MQLHELKPSRPRQTAKRIGRGGKRGKTSGRGHKGQKARAGNASTRPEIRDMIKKLPKLRGHGVNRSSAVNSERVLPLVVNVGSIDKAFSSGDTVDPVSIVKSGLVSAKNTKRPIIKILANGSISKPLTVSGCLLSGSAKEKIEKAGGKVV